jgi:hypothetical protein
MAPRGRPQYTSKHGGEEIAGTFTQLTYCTYVTSQVMCSLSHRHFPSLFQTRLSGFQGVLRYFLQQGNSVGRKWKRDKVVLLFSLM